MKILNIYGMPIYESEKETLREAVIEAVGKNADLSRANLSDANLSDANLSRANLSFADLSRANLSDANLSRAKLSFAKLSFANLSRAKLSFADLSRANLSDANLSRAKLSFADLSRANLSDADLSRADLSDAKIDFFAVLSAAPNEVTGLRLAIVEGRINGSNYEGDCACLVGTIANLRHCNYGNIDGLRPDSNRPAERFFLGIKKGDKPETNRVSKIVLGWLDEWASANQAKESGVVA